MPSHSRFDRRHGVKLTAIVISCGLLEALAAGPAAADEVGRDRRDICEVPREIRQDRRELRRDDRAGRVDAVKEDRKEIRDDCRELREDRAVVGLF
jgi:hypothetical protein